MSSITAPLNTATGAPGSMPDTPTENTQAVKPSGACRFSKAFGRVMHRIARPAVHVRRLMCHVRMAWWEVESKYRNRRRLMREARHGAAEFFKLLLALTGLPRVYRTLDRRRRQTGLRQV